MDVIFDVDGTLLDISHRLKFIQPPGWTPETARRDEEQEGKYKKDWKSFRDPAMKQFDKPIMPVIRILNTLASTGNRIIIATGRSRDEEVATKESLSKFIPIMDKIPMYMRSVKDYRKDSVVKKEMLVKMRKDGFDPVSVFDDRPSVIEMWHQEGLFVFDVRDPSKGDF